MAKEVLHVVPLGDGWAVKREGTERASSTHETQKAGIDAARELATVGDDIVIHRPDGTIRNRVTYAGASTNTDEPTRPEAHDLRSVGSRVSWQAVLAGVVVALATSALLTALAAAIGLSTFDQARPRTVTIIAGILWVFVTVVSMLAGGYVATRLTTRETTLESVILGTLVWGTTLALAALGLGAGTGLALNATRAAQSVADGRPFWRDLNWTPDQAKRFEGLTSADRVREELKLDEEAARRYEEVRKNAQEVGQTATPQMTAWWVFTGMALSLSAAIAGALLGCGPDVSRRAAPRTDTTNGATRESSREPVTV
ncbi:MAG: DUF2188 domain-containing protein [Gemmataceae bacterium]